MSKDPAVVGFAVKCKTCGRTKAPTGRSLSRATGSSYCTFECKGYTDLPHPGDLFPGETAEEFGYTCSGPTVEDPAAQGAKEVQDKINETGCTGLEALRQVLDDVEDSASDDVAVDGGHTPGPWEANGGYIQLPDKDYETLAEVKYPFVTPNKGIPELRRLQELQKANAELIAQAPDLLRHRDDALDALKRFVASSACSNGCDPMDMSCDTNFAKAVIADIEGEKPDAQLALCACGHDEIDHLIGAPGRPCGLECDCAGFIEAKKGE